MVGQVSPPAEAREELAAMYARASAAMKLSMKLPQPQMPLKEKEAVGGRSLGMTKI